MFYFFWHGVFAVHLNLLAQLKNIRKNQDIKLKTLLLNSSSTLVRHSLLTIYDGIRRPLILRHILSGLHFTPNVSIFPGQYINIARFFFRIASENTQGHGVLVNFPK